MIRKAVVGDLESIVNIAAMAKSNMKIYGNSQWNEDYPNEQHFLADIEEGTLYVAVIDERVAGMVCINREIPEEYKKVMWHLEAEHVVLHRLAVDPKFFGKGVGRALIAYADDICRAQGLRYIKTDTNELNASAQKLLRDCGYAFVGDIDLYGKHGRFYCFDRILPLIGADVL